MLYKERKPRFFSAKYYPGENFYPGFTKKAAGNGYCNSCGRPITEHLLSDDNRSMVCPNMYIIYEGLQVINIMSKANFESIYEPLYTEEGTT